MADILHEMDRNSGDLIAEPLGGDDGDFFKDLVVVEIDSINGLARVLLHGLGANSSHGGGGESGGFYIC